MHDFLIALAICGIAALVLATMLGGAIARLGFPLPPDDRRIGCIDGLRGYLALAVMIHHFFLWVQESRMGVPWGPAPFPFLNQLGAGGVGLFFMTTGLVFYPRVLKGLRATSWPTVYITRIFRIIPLTALSVAIITVIVMVRTGATLDRHYVPAAAQWVSGWREPPLLGYNESARINAQVLWSLRLEWGFYLVVLPIAAAAMDLVRGRSWPSWVLPVAFLGLSVGARLLAPASIAQYQVPRFLPLFAVGMLAFESQANTRLRTVLSGGWTGVAAVAALLIGMASADFPYDRALPLFAFFFICVACGNSFGGLLRTRGALVLGECSFGIYLLHGIVLDLLFVDGKAIPAALPTIWLPVLLPAAMIVIVLVTPVTYLLVERPAMRWGRTLAKWVAGRRSRLSGREIEVAP